MYASSPVNPHRAFPPDMIKWLQFSQEPGLYLSHEPPLLVGMLLSEHTQSSPE